MSIRSFVLKPFRRVKNYAKLIASEILPLNLYISYLNFLPRDKKFGLKCIDSHFFLSLLARKYKDLHFIQIGANDGITNDPIHNLVKLYHWKGVLIEPLPNYFEQLKKNYAGFEQNLKFENVGITDQASDLSFYYLPSEYNDPTWLQQIGTFDRKAIEYNLEVLPEFIDKIAKKKIPTISMAEIIEKNKIKNIDLLVVDVEGYEYVILKQIADLTFLPKFILYEWGCLSDADRNDTIDLLKKLHYQLFIAGGDFLAIKK